MYRSVLSRPTVVFVFVLLVGVTGRAEGVFPGSTWQRAAPESQHVNAVKLKEAVDFMDQHFGPDGAKELVIVRNGCLIWEGPKADARNHDFRGRYGFYWWVNGSMSSGRRPWPAAPPRTYTAHGRGCNFCFVIPEWNMVVVRMGTVPISAGNIAQGDRLCDEFFRRLAGAIDD